jgi:hypothetical protein
VAVFVNSLCLLHTYADTTLTLTIVYQCVSARLQYGCSKSIGADSDAFPHPG